MQPQHLGVSLIGDVSPPNASVPQLKKDSTTGGSAAVRDFNPAYVRFGSGTDITRSPSNVRFTPQSGQTADISICLLCAKSGLMHRNMRARSAVLLAPSLRMMLARWNSTVTRKTAIGMLVSSLTPEAWQLLRT